MVCGRDYHGNQIGAGCGRNFNWSSAPRYEPRIAAEDNRADRIALVVPEQVMTAFSTLFLSSLYRCCTIGRTSGTRDNARPAPAMRRVQGRRQGTAD